MVNSFFNSVRIRQTHSRFSMTAFLLELSCVFQEDISRFHSPIVMVKWTWMKCELRTCKHVIVCALRLLVVMVSKYWQNGQKLIKLNKYVKSLNMSNLQEPLPQTCCIKRAVLWRDWVCTVCIVPEHMLNME